MRKTPVAAVALMVGCSAKNSMDIKNRALIELACKKVSLGSNGSLTTPPPLLKCLGVNAPFCEEGFHVNLTFY